MAVSRALRRLLRVLTIEEEQARLALESAIGTHRQLEYALTANNLRDRSGRQLVVASAHTGELPDRLAGLEETRSAKRRALALASRIAQAEAEVDARRAAFLAKRVECRQAETLIRESEAKEAIIAGRRAQQGLDDWYLNRLHSSPGAAGGSPTAVPSGRTGNSTRPGNSTTPGLDDTGGLDSPEGLDRPEGLDSPCL